MQAEFNYGLLFEAGKKYSCEIVSHKNNSCQIHAEGVPVQLLGLARNFVFPSRPVFSELVGWQGECEVELNLRKNGLFATKIVLKMNEMK
ncbi:MAG: hypothetical protein U9R06_03415 [Patescibacteria group bacterium]|nr:hypothetical protein [Patescibacteria group bacterium]